jgi:hypothetical protein
MFNSCGQLHTDKTAKPWSDTEYLYMQLMMLSPAMPCDAHPNVLTSALLPAGRPGQRSLGSSAA